MKKFFAALIAISLLTAPVLAQNSKITTGDLKIIQPQADSFSDKKTLDGIDYFDALKNKDLVGYCIIVKGTGYRGPMKLIVGIDKKGVIQGLKVLEHTETIGFGSRINEDSFLGQFRGKDAGAVSVGKNIDAVTGATISSKAVTDVINETVKKFLSRLFAHQGQLGKK